MSELLEKPRVSTLDIARSLALAVSQEIGGTRMSLRAGYGDQMLVISDISEAASQFTVGVFITTASQARRWYECAFKPWNAHRPHPNERLSYKKYSASKDELDDLRSYTVVANQCPGLLLSVVSPNQSQRVVTDARDVKLHADLTDFRTWSDPIFERLMRSSCAISIGMQQFFCHPDRWSLLHDTDELYEPIRRETSILWLNGFISAVRDGEVTPMLLTTKEEVADPLFARALLGIPDVAAGGTGSGIHSWNDKYGLAKDQFVGEEGDVKEKDEVILNWFGANSGNLVKRIVSYGDEPDSGCIHLIGLARRGGASAT